MAKQDNRLTKGVIQKALRSKGLTMRRDFQSHAWVLSNGERFATLNDIWDAKIIEKARAPKKVVLVDQFEEEETGEDFAAVDIGTGDTTVVTLWNPEVPQIVEECVQLNPMGDPDVQEHPAQFRSYEAGLG